MEDNLPHGGKKKKKPWIIKQQKKATTQKLISVQKSDLKKTKKQKTWGLTITLSQMLKSVCAN